MSELIFTPWRKYGHDRTYIATADGQKLGHLDNKNGELVLLDESWRPAVEAALSGSLTGAPAVSSLMDDAAIPLPPDAGLAGGSAKAEHQRRVARREQRIRQAHPRLGGLILALSDDPQSTRAWASGAVGEAPGRREARRSGR